MIVGPGSIQDNVVQEEETLFGAGEFEYVTIFNPLTDDFAVKVGQTKPVDVPFEIRSDGKTSVTSTSEAEVTRTYGIGLKNPDFQGRMAFGNTSVIKSGQSINMRGDDAQVAVRQLVNELLQREGKSLFLADPKTRREAEHKIIKARGSINDLMSNTMQSVQSQTDAALAKSNEVHDEQEFPGVTSDGSSEAIGSGGSQPEAQPEPAKDAGTKKAKS
jgi:hypothetical protein